MSNDRFRKGIGYVEDKQLERYHAYEAAIPDRRRVKSAPPFAFQPDKDVQPRHRDYIQEPEARVFLCSEQNLLRKKIPRYKKMNEKCLH